MKNIHYILILILVAAFTSCDEDFLVKDNLYEISDANYYSTPEQIDAALTAAYACTPANEGNNNPILLANLMSDDCFGGGGTNDNGFHDTDAFTNSTSNYYSSIWESTYQGILRVNMIIKRFDNAEYKDEEAKNQALGEAYFLRGYFYLRLAQLFGNVPLVITPEPLDLPKAEHNELFGQILYDFKTASELMNTTKFKNISDERLGHATKWAAQGMTARAFLFYTGKYEKSEALLADGSTLSKNEVISMVDDCVANSGHDLVSDFRNLWSYSYANQTYKYAMDNNLEWVGDDRNVESVFSINYSPYGGWNAPNKMSYSNQLALFMSVRTGGKNLQDFGQGWGGGTVNSQLYDSYEEGDVRKEGSIINVMDSIEGDIYNWYSKFPVGNDSAYWNADNTVHETGLWQKKYTSVKVEGTGMFDYILGVGTQSNYQLWNMMDEIVLRFSDILLMGAELGSSNAQDYFDRVRTRAGLSPKTVSLDAIKVERRHELALEGIRHFDLLRWHDEVEVYGNVKNIPVLNAGFEDTYTSTYRSETNGFLPIPESEIALSNEELVQNPGW
ncbi:MAG: RagB/SusD family nutrient uptake outer membrane protein [Prolixibacteraceae bacterium]|nr:RagB/SusD family nutrient uptake outer membrane protein [Prolixibacteraceae bacterium]